MGRRLGPGGRSPWHLGTGPSLQMEGQRVYPQLLPAPLRPGVGPGDFWVLLGPAARLPDVQVCCLPAVCPPSILDLVWPQSAPCTFHGYEVTQPSVR